jgi:hypothetical protein
MAGHSRSRVVMPLGEFDAVLGTGIVNCGFGQRLGILRDTPDESVKLWMPVRERPLMTPEFYLVLKSREPDDSLADAVYEAGFDDSTFTVRSGHAAIWITDREGELTELVREALAQARQGGLEVLHVEMESAVFA